MRFEEALKEGKNILEEAGIEDAHVDSLLLLEKVTGLNRAGYLVAKQDEMNPKDYSAYMALIKRRAEREPCQYVIGSTEFMGLKFKVNENVLIPRQDTETLVEEALKIIEMVGAEKVLDLCTGSGAIAISIKHLADKVSVTASDISEQALDVAKENAIANKVEVGFVLSDMFDAITEKQFDIILSNPPYVTDDEYENLMPEVKNFEPKGALKAGKDGLDCYRVIAKKACDHLRPKGYILLEIGCEQADDLRRLLKDDFEEIKIVKDLAGRDRVVIARAKDKQ